MTPEEDRMWRMIIGTIAFVLIGATRDIWRPWLFKIGYRDWRKPDENPYEVTEKEPPQRQP